MKKLLSLILAVAMVLTMGMAIAEEPFVLTVMLPDFYTDYDFQVEDNPVLKHIEEATGCKLDITWVANSAYGDQISLTLADPENMPMLISLTGARDPIVIETARAGAFWDLTDLIPEYEWLSQGPAGIYNNIAIDGNIYGIYRSRAYPRAGIYYRTDIAKEMGITEEPTTIEELTELAEALASYSEDTYALNMCKYVAGTINIITVAMGAPQTWGVDENGEIYPAHTDPAYFEGLTWLRHLYEIRGIDPDFMTIESGNWNDAERQSKAFMRFDCLDNGYRQQEWFEQNEGVTEDIWGLIPCVAKEDGSITLWPQNPGFAGEIVVTKTVKEEDLDKVMAFLDWCNSPDGTTTLNWGVEGVTYFIREDGFRYSTPSDDVDTTASINTIQHSLNQLGMGVAGDFSPKASSTALRDEYEYINNNYGKYAVSDPCYALTSETQVKLGATLSQMLEDAAVQYIAGIIDEDGLRAVWEQWAAEGGAQITAEYNDAYQAIQD